MTSRKTKKIRDGKRSAGAVRRGIVRFLSFIIFILGYSLMIIYIGFILKEPAGSVFGCKDSWQHAVEESSWTQGIIIGIISLFFILHVVVVVVGSGSWLRAARAWRAVVTSQAAFAFGLLTLWINLNSKSPVGSAGDIDHMVKNSSIFMLGIFPSQARWVY